MTTTTTTIPAAAPATTGTAPDLSHPALAAYRASLPPDDDPARLGDELTAAWAALATNGGRGDRRKGMTRPEEPHLATSWAGSVNQFVDRYGTGQSVQIDAFRSGEDTSR